MRAARFCQKFARSWPGVCHYINVTLLIFSGERKFLYGNRVVDLYIKQFFFRFRIRVFSSRPDPRFLLNFKWNIFSNNFKSNEKKYVFRQFFCVKCWGKEKNCNVFLGRIRIRFYFVGSVLLHRGIFHFFTELDPRGNKTTAVLSFFILSQVKPFYLHRIYLTLPVLGYLSDQEPRGVLFTPHSFSWIL